MTPKEKADELCLKYYKIIERTLSIEHVKITKQCALIAVDEMMDEGEYTDGYYQRSQYWNEVKQELKNYG